MGFREAVTRSSTYKSFEDLDDCFRIEDDLKFTHDESKSSLDEIFNVDNYSNVDSDEVIGDEVRKRCIFSIIMIIRRFADFIPFSYTQVHDIISMDSEEELSVDRMSKQSSSNQSQNSGSSKIDTRYTFTKSKSRNA